MKKTAVLLVLHSLILVLWTGCGDKEGGPTGVPPTEETILGKWVLKTYHLSGEGDVTAPLLQLDTTVQIDTLGAFPDGGYYEFKADGTYESNVNVDFYAMLREIGIRLLTKTSPRPVEEGEWYIEGEQLALIQSGDTTFLDAKISGNNLTVSFDEEVSESGLGYNVSGLGHFVFTGSK